MQYNGIINSKSFKLKIIKKKEMNFKVRTYSNFQTHKELGGREISFYRREHVITLRFRMTWSFQAQRKTSIRGLKYSTIVYLWSLNKKAFMWGEVMLTKALTLTSQTAIGQLTLKKDISLLTPKDSIHTKEDKIYKFHFTLER